jgi:glycosyltransferase involved in cell wall biosynthesis
MPDHAHYPQISVIIPARNAARTLPKLLDSLGHSSLMPREIIVVDDASVDATLAICQQYQVRIIQQIERVGPARARNIGAAAASSDILVFLDADVMVMPHTLAQIAQAFRIQPDLIGLSGVYAKIPANEGYFPRYKAALTHFWFRDCERFESFETACAAISKVIFDRLGGFDERYRGADVEDYEFGYRLGQLGPIRLDNRIEVAHHFPGFLKNAVNYYQRTRLWATLFWSRRRFDSAATSRREGLGQIGGGLSIVCLVGTLVLGPIWPVLAWISALGGLLAGLLFGSINARFFRFLWQEGGWRLGLYGSAVHALNSVVISLAVGHSWLSYLGSRILGRNE